MYDENISIFPKGVAWLVVLRDLIHIALTVKDMDDVVEDYSGRFVCPFCDNIHPEDSGTSLLSNMKHKENCVWQLASRLGETNGT